jgi:hypothetical protein
MEVGSGAIAVPSGNLQNPKSCYLRQCSNMRTVSRVGSALKTMTHQLNTSSTKPHDFERMIKAAPTEGESLAMD